MTSELTIKKELSGLDASKAEQIEAVFSPMVKMLKGFETKYDEVINLKISPEKCTKAKRLRIDISKVRIDADKVRKVQKEEYLRAGNAIQGVYNILKFAVVDKEDSLKEIETHYERIEEEKKIKLQEERQLELEKYDVDGSQIDLGSMREEIWSNFLTGSKSNYAAGKEAERKVEEIRQAAIKKAEAEQKRIKAENKKLLIEREKEAKERKAADEKAEAERLKLVKEKEAIEAKARGEREKLIKEKEAAERKIRAEREAAEVKELERVRVERKKAETERKAREVEAMAPDREKLAGWADALEAKIESLSTDVAKAAVKRAVEILAKTAIEMEVAA